MKRRERGIGQPGKKGVRGTERRKRLPNELETKIVRGKRQIVQGRRKRGNVEKMSKMSGKKRRSIMIESSTAVIKFIKFLKATLVIRLPLRSWATEGCLLPSIVPLPLRRLHSSTVYSRIGIPSAPRKGIPTSWQRSYLSERGTLTSDCGSDNLFVCSFCFASDRLLTLQLSFPIPLTLRTEREIAETLRFEGFSSLWGASFGTENYNATPRYRAGLSSLLMIKRTWEVQPTETVQHPLRNLRNRSS